LNVGDLLYLEVVTLEDKTYHITGCTSGFFVNASKGKSFNPAMGGEKVPLCSTLVSLLSRLSPGFKKIFSALLVTEAHRHPYEMLTVSPPVYPWMAPKEKSNSDPSRAEDFLILTSELDLKGNMRDWNEEYQSSFELPSSTVQERMLRERQIHRVVSDFVEAAIKGVVSIVEGTVPVPPLNPSDPERGWMFLYNNIFFSYATDGRDYYKTYGGDKAVHVSFNNDLKGLRLVQRANVKGLHTLATAVVDYRGFRLCAQSIIPGILNKEQTVVYGSIDGKVLAWDKDFHALLSQLSVPLHLKEHKIKDQKGNTHPFFTPVESKGIVGQDGRKYLLDLIRFSPRDISYPGAEETLTSFHHELIDTYRAFLTLKKQEEKEKEKEAMKK